MSNYKEQKTKEGVPFCDLINMPFAGSVAYPTGAGGCDVLHAAQALPGLYTTAWAIHNKHAKRFMKRHPHSVLSVVVNTNRRGGPEISVRLQAVELIPDEKDEH